MSQGVWLVFSSGMVLGCFPEGSKHRAEEFAEFFSSYWGLNGERKATIAFQSFTDLERTKSIFKTTQDLDEDSEWEEE